VFRPGLLLNFNGIHIQGDNNIFWNSGDGEIWGTDAIYWGVFATSSLQENAKFCVTLVLKTVIYKSKLLDFQNFESLAFDVFLLKIREKTWFSC
jgi:hypothetical protein